MTAPTPRTFQRAALMKWNGNKITDHNRTDLSVTFIRIENTQRMANGTLRRFLVATKREFSTSWDDLPSTGPWTVDGFWGGKEMLDFWTQYILPFPLAITNGQGVVETYQVIFNSFDYDIVKRGKTDFWNVRAGMEEI